MRLIDANRFEVVGGVVPEGYDVESYLAGNREILEMIDKAPTVDAVPREEYEALLKRFRHLMQSKFIASFDVHDLITHTYKRDIREADIAVYAWNRRPKSDNVDAFGEADKLPEKIKAGFHHCSEAGCKGCPYEDDCHLADGGSELARDGLAYVRQLENQLENMICDFMEYVNGGVPNPAPFCGMASELCVNARGWCQPGCVTCNGFVPKVRDDVEG